MAALPRQRWTTLLVLALAAAPGAAQSPAEASRPPAPQSPAPDAGFQRLLLPSDLAGRSYYGLEDGLTCRSNTPERTRIKTWRQRLEFRGDTVLIWGTLCNDAASEVPLQTVRDDLTIRPALDAVRFRDQTLTYAAEPPRLCDAGIWCPVADPEEPK